jgi:hypothetical protein
VQICGVQATMQQQLSIANKRKTYTVFNSTQPSKNRAITVGFQLYVASWISEWQPPGRQKHPVRQNKTLTHALTLKNRPQYTFLHPKIGLRNHTKHYNPHTFSINHHYIITLFTPLSTCNSSRFIFTTTLHSTYNYLLINRLLTAYKYLLNR